MLRSRRMMCNAKPKSSIDNSTSGVIVLSDSDDSSAGAKPAAQNPVVMRFNKSVAEAKAAVATEKKTKKCNGCRCDLAKQYKFCPKCGILVTNRDRQL